MTYDWDKLGIKEPAPCALAGVSAYDYMDAVEWIKPFLNRHDYIVTRVAFDPAGSVWFFYEDEKVIARIEHALMVRIMVALGKSC